MNLYALLPLTAFFANIILSCYILYRDPKKNLNRLYALFTFALAIWALSDFLVLTSPTPGTALKWNRLGACGSSTMPVFVLHFFLVFTKREFISNKKIYIPLYLPSLFFLFVNFTTDLITKSFKLSWWGYAPVPGIMYPPFSLYAALYVIAGLFVCYRFYIKTPSAKEKIQAKLLLIAVTIPTAGGVITQVIPSFIGLEMIQLTTTLTAIPVLIIAYSMVKYEFMSITPGMAAGKIIETIADYIVAVDNNNDISFVNEPGVEALGYKKGELVKKPLSIIFAEKELLECQLSKELKDKCYLRNYETEILTKDKKRIPTSINASVITDRLNNVIGFVFAIRDITERKRAEENLCKTMSDLERFNRLAVGRELQMIELKREINELLHSMGRQEKYNIPTSENKNKRGA